MSWGGWGGAPGRKVQSGGGQHVPGVFDEDAEPRKGGHALTGPSFMGQNGRKDFCSGLPHSHRNPGAAGLDPAGPHYCGARRAFRGGIKAAAYPPPSGVPTLGEKGTQRSWPEGHPFWGGWGEGTRESHAPQRLPDGAALGQSTPTIGQSPTPLHRCPMTGGAALHRRPLGGGQ